MKFQGKLQNILKLNEKQNTLSEFWDAARAVFRGKLNAFIRKEESPQVHDLRFYFSKVRESKLSPR